MLFRLSPHERLVLAVHVLPTPTPTPHPRPCIVYAPLLLWQSMSPARMLSTVPGKGNAHAAAPITSTGARWLATQPSRPVRPPHDGL